MPKGLLLVRERRCEGDVEENHIGNATPSFAVAVGGGGLAIGRRIEMHEIHAGVVDAGARYGEVIASSACTFQMQWG